MYWLATNSGLFSYDGREFIKHKHDKQLGESVFNLRLDPVGNLWYNNFSGQVFCRTTDSIRLVVAQKKDRRPQLFTLDKSDRGILIFDKGCIIHHQPDRVDTLFSPYNNYNFSNVIQKDDLSFFWYNDTLYQIEAQSCVAVKGFTNLPKYAGSVRLFSFGDKFFIDITSTDRNYVLDISGTEAIVRNDLEMLANRSVIRVIQKENSAWFLTGGGALHYRYQKDAFILEEHLLKSITVTDMIVNKEGYRIFTTLDRGLFILPCSDCKKLKLPHIDNRRINNMIHDGETNLYFISDQNVLHQAHSERETYLKVNIDPHLEQYITIDPYAQELLLFNNGLVKRMDLTTLDVIDSTRAEMPKKLLFLDDKKSIGSYYFGARVWYHHFQPDYVLTMEPRGRTIAMTDNKKDVYIAFHATLVYTDTCFQNKSTILVDGQSWATELLTAQPLSEMLWAERKGEILALQKGEIKKDIRTKDGLYSNQIRHIIADTNYLFIAHRNHIQVLAYENDSIYNFPYYPFLKKSLIQELSLLKDRLLINAGDVIYQVPKFHFKSENNFSNNTLTVNRFSINEVPQTIQSVYQLSQNEQQIIVEVCLPKMFSRERVNYQYRWHPKTNWQSFPEGANQLVLNNIPYGKNQLSLRAKANYDEEHTPPIHLQINRAYPLWQQWWFFALIALMIASLSYFFFWLFQRRKQKKLQVELEQISQEREMVYLQLENLRSQMNPHFVFNALNSIQDYIVSNERRQASKFLVKFSRLIRLYLEHSRTAEITLEEELKALSLYLALEKDRFEKSLHYSIFIAPSLPTEKIYIPSLLLQPYVENALNHGLLHKVGFRSISITFGGDKEHLICIIEDNGIGRLNATKRKGDTQHKSFATRANADRIALINRNLDQKLEVFVEDLVSASGKAAGTKVSIKIPLKYENSYH